MTNQEFKQKVLRMAEIVAELAFLEPKHAPAMGVMLKTVFDKETGQPELAAIGRVIERETGEPVNFELYCGVDSPEIVDDILADFEARLAMHQRPELAH